MSATVQSSAGVTIDLDHLRQWVGRERTTSDDMAPGHALGLATALDLPRRPAVGDALPLCWQWLYFLDTPTRSNTGVDGHARTGDFLPPVPLPRRMWASSTLRLTRALRLGRPASRLSRVRSIDAKSGKSGSLVFVTLDHTITQDDALCCHEEQHLVYRDMPSAATAPVAGEPAPTNAMWSRVLQADPVLLFRYSALTYNGHRIHYDRAYAMEQEFYPALVVQGPLLATLLMQFVSDCIPEAIVTEFEFRGVRPVFDTNAFTVCGSREGNRVRLWIADHEGTLCTTASALLA